MRNMVACLTEGYPPAHWLVETLIKRRFRSILTATHGNCMLLQLFGFPFLWRKPLPRRRWEML